MSLEKIGSMGDIAFLIFAILSIVLAALLGIKRGIFKSAVRTVSMFASMLVSFFLVKMLLPSLLKMLVEKILDFIGDSEEVLQDILQAETSFAVIEALVLAFIAPLMFALVYFVVNKLFLIVCFIANTAMKPIRATVEKKIPCQRLFGALISVIGAIVTLVVISTPIAGYTEMLDHTVAHIEESEEHDETVDGIVKTLHEIEPLTHGFSESVAVSIPYKMGGRLLYNNLTSIHIEKNEGVIDEAIDTSLEDELIGVLDLLPVAKSFAEISFADIEGMNIDPLRRVAAQLADEDSSNAVRIVMADIFATASNKWLNDEAFLTINLMGLLEGDAEVFRPSVEVILKRLANTHVSSVGQDVIELVDTFDGIQVTYVHMLNIAETLGRGEEVHVEDVVNMLDSLTPLSAEAISASLPAMVEKTGVDAEYAEAIGGVLSDALIEMADLNADKNADPALVEKEAHAIKSVMTVASKPNTNMTNEEADELIDTVMDSVVLSHSIRNSVEEAEDHVPTIALPEESADLVQNKLDEYESENELDEEKQATIDSLRVFFTTKVEVEEDADGGSSSDLEVDFDDLLNQ